MERKQYLIVGYYKCADKWKKIPPNVTAQIDDYEAIKKGLLIALKATHILFTLKELV